jgi:hypothetical protein
MTSVRRSSLLTAVCVGVFFAVVAFAGAEYYGVHSNNGSEHGIGDSAVIDGHVHDYITCGTQSTCLQDWTRYQAGNKMGTRSCTCHHLHDDIYPSLSETAEAGTFEVTVDYNPPDNVFNCHPMYHPQYFGRSVPSLCLSNGG